MDLSANTKLETLHCDENQLKELDVSNMTELKILTCDSNELTGLVFGKIGNLQELKCSNNELTTLDCSNLMQLEGLECKSNRLTSLDVSNSVYLSELACDSNELTNLLLGKKEELKELKCIKNKLTTLDISNLSLLEILECGENQLNTLDVSHSANLKLLNCESNQLAELDISKNSNLLVLYCGMNAIKELDLKAPSELVTLSCEQNQIASLNFDTIEHLEYLNCSGNLLQELDIGKNENIFSLDCSQNNLRTLDISKLRDLSGLKCNKNSIKSIDIGNCPFLMDVVDLGNVELDGEKGVRYSRGDVFNITELVIDFGVDIQPNNASFVRINEINFPNARVRNYIREKFDKDKDGILSAYERSIKIIEFPLIYPEDEDQVDTLKGIEYFTELEKLDFRIGKFKEVDLSKNTKLRELIFDHTQIENLDLSNNLLLENINVCCGKLKNLDVSKHTKLKSLDISGSDISEIDLSNNPELEELDCSYTKIANLNLEQNTNLLHLTICDTKIGQVDISNCQRLVKAMKEGRNRSLQESYLYYSSDIEGETDSLMFDDGVKIIENGEELPYVVNYSVNDVDRNAWYYKGVEYVRKAGVMVGVSQRRFAPNEIMTRAQFVKVLYNLEGEPKVDASNSFVDVEDGQWYTDAVNWAVKNEVTKGLSDQIFGTNQEITREQLVTLLYNYMTKVKSSKFVNGYLQSFKDADQISEWAWDPFRWAVGNQIINGQPSNGGYKINPQGIATRAECAVIMKKVLNP